MLNNLWAWKIYWLSLKGSTDPLDLQWNDYPSWLQSVGKGDRDEWWVLRHRRIPVIELLRGVKAFAYMVGTPKEVAGRFEEQARVQKEQQEMLRVQQEFINDLKEMITHLLTNRKKKSKGPRPNTPPARARGNRSRENVLLLRKMRVRTTPILKPPNLHLRRWMV